MQPLSHDIDQLIRKAARDYSLKEWEGDWNSISARIDIPPRKSTGRYRFFAIFLIALLLVGIEVLYIEMPTGAGNNVAVHPKIANDKQALHFTPVTKVIEKGDKSLHQLITGRSTIDKLQNNADQITPSQTPFHPGIYLPGPRNINNKFFPHFPATSVSSKHQALSLRDIFNRALEEKTAQSPGIVKRIWSRLYGGVAAGPQFSEACSQGISKTGYHAGFLIGYKLNNKISFESGLLYSVRKFYTDGKFFDTKKIQSTMPAGMEIMEVDVRGALLEFPFKLRYDIVRKYRSEWFVSGGLSAHLYLNEKNNYVTKMNGTMENKRATYNEVACSGISLINISAGYDHSISKSTRIRIEPYFKIPVRKVGMGKLPVFNTGLTVAVTSQFKRQ